MSEKECGHDEDSGKTFLHRGLYILFAIIVAILLAILIIWLILRPTKPQFTLQIASIAAFNLTSPYSLTTRLLLTLTSRNPNSDIGIYYDSLHTYAAYHGQRISLSTLLPPMYQDHKETTVWSPFLIGDAMPLAPYLAAELNQEEITGAVLVNVRVNGVIRWKVGAVITGNYRLDVNCPVFLHLGAVKYPLDDSMGCHVEAGPS